MLVFTQASRCTETLSDGGAVMRSAVRGKANDFGQRSTIMQYMSTVIKMMLKQTLVLKLMLKRPLVL